MFFLRKSLKLSWKHWKGFRNVNNIILINSRGQTCIYTFRFVHLTLKAFIYFGSNIFENFCFCNTEAEVLKHFICWILSINRTRTSFSLAFTFVQQVKRQITEYLVRRFWRSSIAVKVSHQQISREGAALKHKLKSIWTIQDRKDQLFNYARIILDVWWLSNISNSKVTNNHQVLKQTTSGIIYCPGCSNPKVDLLFHLISFWINPG